MIEMIASNLVGAIVAWLVSRWYYIKASEDLKKEAGELRKLNSCLMIALEHAGLIKLTRNGGGELTGVALESKGAAQGVASVSGVSK